MNQACRYHRLAFGVADPQCRGCRLAAFPREVTAWGFCYVVHPLVPAHTVYAIANVGTKPDPFPMLPEVP